MVIVAILVGGGFFGIFGMFVGVPACAVICTVIRNGIQNRLTKKCMPIDLESYQNIDHLDAETLKPVAPSQRNREVTAYLKVIVKFGQKRMPIMK